MLGRAGPGPGQRRRGRWRRRGAGGPWPCAAGHDDRLQRGAAQRAGGARVHLPGLVHGCGAAPGPRSQPACGGKEREAAPGLPRRFRAAPLRCALGMLVGFPCPGKAKRSMASVARSVGAVPVAFSAVAQQPARRGQPARLCWEDALGRSLSENAALGGHRRIGLCPFREQACRDREPRDVWGYFVPQRCCFLRKCVATTCLTPPQVKKGQALIPGAACYIAETFMLWISWFISFSGFSIPSNNQGYHAGKSNVIFGIRYPKNINSGRIRAFVPFLRRICSSWRSTASYLAVTSAYKYFTGTVAYCFNLKIFSSLQFYVKDYLKVYELISSSWGCWISYTDMEVIFFHTASTLMLTQSYCSLM